MKKLLSMLLALIMVFSLATVALAEETQTNNSVKITKNYEVKHGKAPAETFSFVKSDGTTAATNVAPNAYATYSVNSEGTGVWTPAETVPTDAPTITVGSAAFSNDKDAATTAYTADATITVSSYTKAPVGKYTYTVKEKTGTTAGVTYYGSEIKVVVTILNGGDGNSYVAAVHTEASSGTKSDEITNTYDAGTLSVTKEIKGEGAEMDDEFEFTITLTAPTGTKFNDVQNVSVTSGGQVVATKDTTNSTDSKVIYTVTLGNGDTCKLENIPVGTTYTITENAQDYTESHADYDKDDKTIAGGADDSFTFTNTRGMNNIDTGVITESAPYILLIAVCAVAAVLFVTKRRRVEF